jgi:hypothetical protein
MQYANLLHFQENFKGVPQTHAWTSGKKSKRIENFESKSKTRTCFL